MKYVPSIETVKVATKVVAEVNVTAEAVILAPLVELTASTRGIDAKPVPVIVMLEAVLSITDGLIEVNVGPASVVVIEPEAPKATVTELYVTELFCNAAF